jgi:hypothetical protein
MSRKRCIRRHYALVCPITLAISGATITAEADLDKLRLRELSAIESFSKGTATPHEFRDLCDMLNLAQTLGETGVGPEVLPVCESVEAELLAAKGRHDQTGRLGITGAGLRAMRDLYEFHDLQRTSINRSQYEQAILRTRNKIRGAHPDVKVLA